MSDTSELTILTEEVTAVETTTTTETVTEALVDGLVGEGKKYKSVDELAKGYQHADAHIKTILTEKQDLETEVANLKSEKKTVEEIMTAINDAGSTPPVVEPIKPEPTTAEPTDVAALIEAALTKKDEADQAKVQAAAILAKRTEIQGKLKEDLGSAEILSETIKNYANGDKAKLAAIDSLVLADYDAAVELLKKHVPETTNFSNGPTKVQTSANVPLGLTWSKCLQIKKTDPKLYHSVGFKVAMHKAMNDNENFITS